MSKTTTPICRSKSVKRSHHHGIYRNQLSLEGLEDRVVPATRTWIGPMGGLWSTGGNWTGGKSPGEFDTAIIGGGTAVIVDLIDVEVQALILGDTTLTLDVPRMRVNSVFRQFGGTIQGQVGRKQAILELDIDNRSGLPGESFWDDGTWSRLFVDMKRGNLLMGGKSLTLRDTTFVISPEEKGKKVVKTTTAEWKGGNLILEGKSAIGNGSRFLAAGDGKIIGKGAHNPSFQNLEGDFIVSSGKIDVNLPFSTSGEVRVETGHLAFHDGGMSASSVPDQGLFHVNTGAVIEFTWWAGTQPYVWSVGTKMTGRGEVKLTGKAKIPEYIVEVKVWCHFTLDSPWPDALTNDGKLEFVRTREAKNIGGRLNWKSGGIISTVGGDFGGRTIIGGNTQAVLEKGDRELRLVKHAFEVYQQGDVQFKTGTLNMSNGSVISNLGRFETGAITIKQGAGPGRSVIRNETDGVFRLDGNGVILVPFENRGNTNIKPGSKNVRSCPM